MDSPGGAPGATIIAGYSHDDRSHPVVRGTRIPVEGILRKLSEGATQADILDAYPRLTHDDIQAALRYAADAVGHEVIVLPQVR